MRILHLLTLAAVVAAPVALYAAPITYTESFVGSGTVNNGQFSVQFSNQLVTLTGMGDTDNVVSQGSGVFFNYVPATFTVAGGLGGAFTDSVAFVSNQNIGAAGLGDETTNYAIMFTSNSAFAAYDLATAIGPLTGSPIFNSGASFATTSGAFSITSAGDATFQATTGASPVPEPSSLLLLGTGALGALGMMRRKFFAA